MSASNPRVAAHVVDPVAVRSSRPRRPVPGALRILVRSTVGVPSAETDAVVRSQQEAGRVVTLLNAGDSLADGASTHGRDPLPLAVIMLAYTVFAFWRYPSVKAL